MFRYDLFGGKRENVADNTDFLDYSAYETPYCCRCSEEFPVAEEPASWRMGELRPAAFLDRSVRRREAILTHDPETRKPLYICGNCYFDLTG